jgi:Xaa-Pro aminopeptidase
LLLTNVTAFFYFRAMTKSILSFTFLICATALFAQNHPALPKTESGDTAKIHRVPSDPAPVKIAPLSDSAKYSRYDKDLLTKEFHRKRREALRALLPDSSVAVFFTNPVRNRSNDVDYEYHQDPDFYYLTGLTEPNGVLLIFKDDYKVGDKAANEMIFVQERNPNKEAWDGRRLGKEGVKEVLGFEAISLNNQFPDFKLDSNQLEVVLFQELFNDVRDDADDKGDLFSLIRHLKMKLEHSKIDADSKNLK